MLHAHKYLVLLFLNWTSQTSEYFVPHILCAIIPNCEMTLISQLCYEGKLTTV